MWNWKQKEPYSPSSAPDPERPGLFDEARAMYTRYADHAARSIAQSHESARTRPAWVRVLTFVGVVLVIIAGLIMAYGAFKWPDAPIRQTPSGFVGKTGLAHTREDYELFELWKSGLLVAFPLAFVVNIGAAIAAKRKNKRNGLGN